MPINKKLNKAEKKQALATLKKVRKFLRPNKKVSRWIKGRWGVGKYGYPVSDPSEVSCACLVGAINTVQGRSPMNGVSFDPAAIALVGNLPRYSNSGVTNRIMQFNDAKNRTEEDVLNVLDKTITELKEDLASV